MLTRRKKGRYLSPTPTTWRPRYHGDRCHYPIEWGKDVERAQTFQLVLFLIFCALGVWSYFEQNTDETLHSDEMPQATQSPMQLHELYPRTYSHPPS